MYYSLFFLIFFIKKNPPFSFYFFLSYVGYVYLSIEMITIPTFFSFPFFIKENAVHPDHMPPPPTTTPPHLTNISSQPMRILHTWCFSHHPPFPFPFPFPLSISMILHSHSNSSSQKITPQPPPHSRQKSINKTNPPSNGGTTPTECWRKEKKKKKNYSSMIKQQ